MERSKTEGRVYNVAFGVHIPSIKRGGHALAWTGGVVLLFIFCLTKKEAKSQGCEESRSTFLLHLSSVG